MPSLCNSTLSSSPDRDDCHYWTSFCEKPFCCGDRLQVYKGKLNGKGPRGGEFSAVKVFVDHPGTETRCSKEVEKACTAADWLARFLAQWQLRQDRVKIAQLQMAPMDQVSLLNKLFSHNKRRPSSGEWILLEEMVQGRGTLVQFVDKLGRMHRDRPGSSSEVGQRSLPASRSVGSGSAPQCTLNNRELLEAFVHFSHHASGGHLVICSLEGVEDERGRVLLKTPVIHSLDKAYGETDLGQPGVLEVMSRHVCNRHCRQMMGLHRSLSLPLPSHPPHPPPLPSFPWQRRIPSAPYELEEGEEVFQGSPLQPAPPYSHVEFSLDLHQLPQDVFYPPTPDMEELQLLFHLELTKSIPDEPPPPYTEYIGQLM